MGEGEEGGKATLTQYNLMIQQRFLLIVTIQQLSIPPSVLLESFFQIFASLKMLFVFTNRMFV